MHNKKPQAVLFDWDNTLVDTFPIIYESLHHTFLKMGHEPWSLEDIKSGRDGIHQALRSSFPRIFGEDKWEEAKQHYHGHFLDIHLEKISTLQGAEDTLKHLKNAGIYMAVVSNKTGPYLRDEVRHLGWDHYFSKVVGATDAVADKPSADPLHLALEGTGIVAGDSVWMVGDSQTDIDSAQNAGCIPLYFGDKLVEMQYYGRPETQIAIPCFQTHESLLRHVKEVCSEVCK